MTKQMVTLSTLCHVIVFTIATFGIPDLFSGPDVSATIIPVELVAIGDETNITTRQARPRERPAAPPRPEPIALREDAVPPPDAVPPIPAAERPTARARPRERPDRVRQPEFDLSQIAALLDRNRQSAPAAEEVEVDTAVPVQSRQAAITDAARFTMSERDALRAQLYGCWTVPAGGRNAEDLVIYVEVALNRDGTLARTPRLSSSSLRRMNDPFYRVAAESALRAIRKCEPFRLPPAKFQEWRDLVLTFDPKEMLN